MKFSVRPKPKIKIKKLIKEGELDVKSVDTKFKIVKELEDDVTFSAEMNIDLNYQVNASVKDRIHSAKVSFTKRF